MIYEIKSAINKNTYNIMLMIKMYKYIFCIFNSVMENITFKNMSHINIKAYNKIIFKA